MNKYEIVRKIEDFAPLDTQEKWDASGWVVNVGGFDTDSNSEVNKIMFALTVTDDIVNQAVSLGCDMIISHHPMFYVPLKYKNINIYCAHTNLDRAQGGTTDTLIEKLGFKKDEDNDFVRFVRLKSPISVDGLKEKLLEISPNLRYVNNNKIKEIKTIAFCAGSGSEFINSTESDAFVTGDLKFHTALDSKQVVFDIGHFESEIFAPEVLLKITEIGENGVIASEKSPFI